MKKKSPIGALARLTRRRGGKSGLAAMAKSLSVARESNESPPSANAEYERGRREMITALVRVTVPLWRAQKRLQRDADGGSGSAFAALRHLERASGTIEECGITIKDYLNQLYDPGMSPFVTPVTFQPDAGSSSETVIETMSPAVFYRGQIVAKSEVVVGVPIGAPELISDVAASSGETRLDPKSEPIVGAQSPSPSPDEPAAPSPQIDAG